MPVLGIGGLFFRARDPEALAAWYRDHLGVGPAGDGQWYWHAEGGETVFAPFKHDTDYFPADRQFMLNLRVSDIDALLDQGFDAGSLGHDGLRSAAAGGGHAVGRNWRKPLPS